MNDLTYEFQRMASRATEIQDSTKRNGSQAAWEQYSREHGLNQQRFRTELAELRRHFDGVASARARK